MFVRGSSTSKALLTVVVILAAAMLWALWPEDKTFEEATGLKDWEPWENLKVQIGVEGEKAKEKVLDTVEKAQIEAWLVQENLNRYGDSEDTMYAGGSPLFDEVTGETIGRFDYILEQHPDKPWQFTEVGKVKGAYDVSNLPYTGTSSKNQFAYRSVRDSLTDDCADIYVYYLGQPGRSLSRLELCQDTVSYFDVVDNWLIMKTRCQLEYRRHILTGAEVLFEEGSCPGTIIRH